MPTIVATRWKTRNFNEWWCDFVNALPAYLRHRLYKNEVMWYDLVEAKIITYTELIQKLEADESPLM